MNANEAVSSRQWWKPLIAVIILAISILGIISLFKFGSVFTFIWVFPFFIDNIVSATGINKWLAWILSVPLAIATVTSLKFLISFKKEKRKKGYVIICTVVIIYSVIMFVAEKDFQYDSAGKETQCYADTPSGYEAVPCSWKVHRIYGTPVKPVSKDIAMALWTKKKGVPKVQRLDPDQDLAFFASDGTPLVWYYQYPDGKIELFQQPGSHPQLGSQIVLSPMNSDIVMKLRKYREENRRSMIAINSTPAEKNAATGTAAPEKNQLQKSELEKLVDTLDSVKIKDK